MHLINVEIETRIDRYLKRLYPDLTQGVIEQYLRKGKIKVNGKKVGSNFRVNNGDELFIFVPISYNKASHTKSFSPSIIKLSEKLLNNYLIYDHEDFIAINKPHGLATQGGSKINNSIDHALKFLNEKGHNFKLVHRLDKETSGILLIAKNYKGAYILTKAFKEKTIEKIYMALVVGTPPHEKGKIECLMSKNKGGAFEVIQEDPLDGKLAITHYELKKKYKDVSLIKFMPLTGKMHQLRLHAFMLGCPIIGDKKYGGEIASKKFKHLLLHAKTIILPESLFNKEILIDTSWPDYFEDFLAGYKY